MTNFATLRVGSRGPHVSAWNHYLVRVGILPPDPDDPKRVRPLDPTDFTVTTERGTEIFQQQAGIDVDGVVGPGTLAAAEAAGFHYDPVDKQAIKMQLAIEQTADALGIERAALRAVAAVEAGGDPRALRFEPHVFLRLRPDLAGRIPYTPKSASQPWSVRRREVDPAAFDRAAGFDPVVAVRSTSWGAGQVMGWALIEAGKRQGLGALESVTWFRRFPLAACRELWVSWFARNRGVAEKLDAHDWEGFARRYNGPGQAAYYGAAIARAYERIAATI